MQAAYALSLESKSAHLNPRKCDKCRKKQPLQRRLDRLVQNSFLPWFMMGQDRRAGCWMQRGLPL